MFNLITGIAQISLIYIEIMKNFVNLKVHSIYPVLENTLKIDRIIELASEKKTKAVCLTDK